MMRKLLISLGLLFALASPALASTCPQTSLQVKDNIPNTASMAIIDDGSGNGTCLSDPTEGTKADTAWSGSGSGSIVAILKAIWAAVTSPVPLGTTGGITPLKLPALTNSAVAIKASAGQLFLLQCGNTNSVQVSVQVFNVAFGSVTVGTTASIPFEIAPNSTGGFALSLQGLQFGTAMSVAATTTSTGGTAPSTAIDCAVGYN